MSEHNLKQAGSHPFVKICGLTDPDAARACADMGADAVGLVFFEKSPRFVSDDRAREISRALEQKTLATGVFVNETYDRIMGKIDKIPLQAVQLHGNEKPELVAKLARQGIIVIKAVFAGKTPFLESAPAWQKASYLLAECGSGSLPGGNAKEWNWSDAARIRTRTPVIVAGGLTPDNVQSALEKSKAAGADISSGVESAPGIKDLKKIKAFMQKTNMRETGE
ncbi:MAG: phosphoribosylanthranilate isomerase [Desulfarculaceae bacterium]|nr:phosphoribosylanthranilate isomerase [Desulfarculaceae bacterium]